MNAPRQLLTLAFLSSATVVRSDTIGTAQIPSPPPAAPAPEITWLPPTEAPLPDLTALAPAEVVESAFRSIYPVLLAAHSRCSRNHDPVIEARLIPLWNLYSASFLDAPLHNAPPEVRRGLRLPAEVVALRHTPGDWTTRLQEARVPFLQGKAEYYRASQLMALGLIAGTSANRAMVELLEQRAQVLPPTRLDLVAFIALRTGMGEIGPGAGPDDLSLERLAPLASAPNPVCRLLALRALASALPHGIANHPTDDRDGAAAVIHDALAQALLGYADETDPSILEEVIRTLESAPCAEAVRTLEQIRTHQTTLGATAATERIAHAIDVIHSTLAQQTSASKP